MFVLSRVWELGKGLVSVVDLLSAALLNDTLSLNGDLFPLLVNGYIDI